MEARLPLFPLGHVLLPGVALPLRVFEPRYRRMLADLAAPGARQAFGVVQLVSGMEVDTGLDEGEPTFARVGTVAEILETEPQPDGTVAVLAVGSRRFRVARLVDATTPYLQADVDFLDEPTGALPDGLADAARALATEYGRLFAELTGSATDGEGSGEPEPAADPFPADAVALSYRLAAQAALSNDDRQALLCDPTAAARLRRIQRVLRVELVLLRATRTVPVPGSALQVALRPN